MCPSGLPHRIRGPLVINCHGREYCWHGDCFATNLHDVNFGHHEHIFESIGTSYGKDFERCSICDETRIVE